MTFARIEDALHAIARGEFVIVVDDEGRENEGDLILAAEYATPQKLAFMVRHTSGLVCVALTPERLSTLQLPLMVADNNESFATAFTVSVDVRVGSTTGISASDRAATLRALADPASTAQDFVRPGHIFPLRARPAGVLDRPGHTEAAVDLARLAGREAVGVLAEVVNDDGSMARRYDLEAFARVHGLLMISIADLVAYRRRAERSVDAFGGRRSVTPDHPVTAHQRAPAPCSLGSAAYDHAFELERARLE